MNSVGNTMALNNATGIISSPWVNYSGSCLFERKKTGSHLGKNVTIHIPKNINARSKCIIFQPFCRLYYSKLHLCLLL
jgi:hypothetical protein